MEVSTQLYATYAYDEQLYTERMSQRAGYAMIVTYHPSRSLVTILSYPLAATEVLHVTENLVALLK
jgi:hypothetical protein